MNREDTIRMARGAGFVLIDSIHEDCAERFAALVAAAEREKVAAWMIQRGYATGHGDTTEDLLGELDWQVLANWSSAMKTGAENEREVILTMLKGIDCTETEDPDGWWETSAGADFGAGILAAIRARGKA